jgi:hypothetical protein
MHSNLHYCYIREVLDRLSNRTGQNTYTSSSVILVQPSFDDYLTVCLTKIEVNLIMLLYNNLPYRMPAAINDQIRKQVIQQWISGDSRDKIAIDNNIGEGTVSGIVNDWK